MTYYCGECIQECTVHIEDEGIGPVEFWGAKSFDSCPVLRSDCCDGVVFEDEALTIEADVGEYAYDEACERADYEYERMREARYE